VNVEGNYVKKRGKTRTVGLCTDQK